MTSSWPLNSSKPFQKLKKKQKMLCFDLKKDIWKVKNALPHWILQNFLEKSDVSENSKVYYGRFLRNRLRERYCYISKYRWDRQYFEKSASHWLLVERWRWNWMTKVFAWFCPRMSIRLIRLSLIKGQASSPCHNFLLIFFITFRLSM